jgi:hypothetical protein
MRAILIMAQSFALNFFRKTNNENLELNELITMHPILKSGLYLISLTFFFFLIYIVYGHVFSNGLSCADDSAFAIAAKNLAFGYGYSTSIPFDGTYGINYFDPNITTGPTMILPASILIRIFGNLPWVPGFVTATINILMIILIFLSVQRKIGLIRSVVLVTVILVFYYIFTAGTHFGYWYSFIGELPAALISVLGVFVLASSPDRRTTVAFACLIFGLAFITKMLTLLGFLPILLWLIIKVIRAKENRKNEFYCLLYGIVAFTAPFILFEIWKLLALGVNGYFHNIIDFVVSFAITHGDPKIHHGFLFITILSERSKLMYDNFGFTLITLLLIAVLAGILIHYFTKHRYIKNIFYLLMSGAFIHLFWWVFLSKGWPRYAIIGLILYFSALSCIIFINRSRIISFSIILLLMVVFSFGNKSLLSPISFVLEYKYEYTPRVKNLLKTAEFLKGYNQDKPFISSWWATYADIEYTMPAVGNFKCYNRLNETDYNRELILVRNTIWVNFYRVPEFEKFEKKFTEVLFFAPPFLVTRSRDVTKKYEPGTLIDFSARGNSADYTTFGWSIQEPDFRWTDGLHAGLRFSIDKKPVNDLILQLHGVGYLAEGNIEHQKVTVLINGQYLTKWEIKGDNFYKAIIPTSLLSSGINDVVFEISNPLSPASFSQSPDTRKLGMAVTKILIDKY